MSQKEKNTLGLIILVLVFLVAFVFVNPMFRYSCSRVVMHDVLGMGHDMLTPGLFLSDYGIIRMIPLTIMFFLWAAVALWVYHDAERRGQSGLLWGLLVFVGNIIGLIIYLIVRASSPVGVTVPIATVTATCPSCEKSVQSTFVACPYCGADLSNKCASCSKRVEPDWKLCPYCGETIDTK